MITQRGIGGGISLAREPESINLCELCVAFDDPLLMKQCVIGMPECADETGCAVHGFWSKQRDKEMKFLQKTTLANIVLAAKRQKRTLEEKSETNQ